MAGNKKSTKGVLNKRVNIVKELIINGISTRAKLLQYISENHNWKVTERQIDNYIAKAYEVIKEDYKLSSEPDRVVSLISQRLEDIFQRASEMDDLNTMRGVMKDFREMLGVDAPKKSEVLNENVNSEKVVINFVDFEND